VPAAAVRHEWLALFAVLGRIGYVGGLNLLNTKSFRWKFNIILILEITGSYSSLIKSDEIQLFIRIGL